jgi:hypothetical protein
MVPDRTILHLVESNYGVNIIKPQLNDISAVALATGMLSKTHNIVSIEG